MQPWVRLLCLAETPGFKSNVSREGLPMVLTLPISGKLSRYKYPILWELNRNVYATKVTLMMACDQEYAVSWLLSELQLECLQVGVWVHFHILLPVVHVHAGSLA
jgi:hypothetical protein